MQSTTQEKNSKSANALQIDDYQLKKGALVFRAINHKLRQKMLALIARSGEISVTHIYVRLRIEQSVASQHLAILRAARLVNTRREGKKIFYSVNFDRVKELHDVANALLEG